jgi:hypothetical protein
MKYEIKLWIFVCILFACILGIIAKEWVSSNSLLEGARTLPRPTRHAHEEEDNQLLKMRPSVKQQSMNDWTDQLITSYFDENNVPYKNAIDKYTSYCVSHGLTTNENKRRLKDLCFYLVNYVIPSLPSITNPTPTVILPPIEFNSLNFNAYNYNASGLANEADNYWRNNPNPMFPTDFTSALNGHGPVQTSLPESTLSTDNQDSTSSSSSNQTGLSSSSGSDDCGNSCPGACLGNLAKSMSSSTTSNQGLNGYGTFDSNIADLYGISDISPDDIYSLAKQLLSPSAFMGNAGYLITNQPNITPNPNNLNSNINSLFSTYFDINNTNTPTPYAIDSFNYFVKHYSPIDDEHKNKLRDLVFYIMEQIIPGLPTEEKPVSYVEWKPIRWLSHSSL